MDMTAFLSEDSTYVTRFKYLQPVLITFHPTTKSTCCYQSHPNSSLILIINTPRNSWRSSDTTWRQISWSKLGLSLVHDYLDQSDSVSVKTHWGRVTHICVSKQTIIGSDNDLSPGRRQAIIWTNAGIVLIGTLGTNFSEILIEIRIFSFTKMGLNVSSAKWLPCCLGLNELNFHSRKFIWRYCS